MTSPYTDLMGVHLVQGREAEAAATRALLSADAGDLMATAQTLRDTGHGALVSYSRKVFIPLTQLCRDVCHYCTFAHPPRRGEAAFLTPDQVVEIAVQGAKAGCNEALFTLGDKPELRYRVVREELEKLGHETTLSYLAECAQRVFDETGLLPHLNPGLMTREDLDQLRGVSVSQGIMLETISDRLGERGGPHFGSPDKIPSRRLDTIARAGEARVPFTSGLLIGLGETREERIDALFALRGLHEEYGHIQEIIIQNFCPKPDTKMAQVPAAPIRELIWTIAAARVIFGPEMNIQAPPNLNPGGLTRLVDAGVNDWGGVSPVTPDHVNPEAPWPHLDRLRSETEAAGKILVERLAIYPGYAQRADDWLAPQFRTKVKQLVDTGGLVRTDDWTPGAGTPPPVAERDVQAPVGDGPRDPEIGEIVDRALVGITPTEREITRLFAARGDDFRAVCQAADDLRRDLVGENVTYVVNRNINYTNICYFKCQFCAFSKGKLSENLRGKPYVLNLDDIKERTCEAWDRGASEVCLQGGIHPEYTGETYLSICRAVKEAVPEMHVHAFSPLEIWQGAKTLGLSIVEFLTQLKEAGLGTLPGTAAEILDDEVRAVLCPDKINTQEWLDVMRTAHGLGIRTTATIMYGHVERPEHWARHLLRILELQKETGGFTELVPLPFVHMEAPIYLKGRARRGPSFRETVLMHAVARLVFHAHIPNIQTSWVKLGPEGLAVCLQAGANDVGGTLMNETISRSAGADFGQEMAPETMEDLIGSLGRMPRQRTTAYGQASNERIVTSFNAADLRPITLEVATKYQ